MRPKQRLPLTRLQRMPRPTSLRSTWKRSPTKPASPSPQSQGAQRRKKPRPRPRKERSRMKKWPARTKRRANRLQSQSAPRRRRPPRQKNPQTRGSTQWHFPAEGVQVDLQVPAVVAADRLPAVHFFGAVRAVHSQGRTPPPSTTRTSSCSCVLYPNAARSFQAESRRFPRKRNENWRKRSKGRDISPCCPML